MVALDRPLLAFRAFEVRGGELYSLLSDFGRWGAGVKTARCEVPIPPGRRPTHQAPGRHCTCGNYGASTLALARRAARHTLRGSPFKRRRVGYAIVRYWGGDHDPVALDALRGGGVQVRAPFAQLVALIRSPLTEPVAARLGVQAVDETVLPAYLADIAEVLDAELVTDELFARLDEPTPGEVLRAQLGRAAWRFLRGLGWGLRHIALPLLLCSLQLVARLGWPVLRAAARSRLVTVAAVLGTAALVMRTFVPPAVVGLVLHAAEGLLVLLVALASIVFALVLAASWLLGCGWRRSW